MSFGKHAPANAAQRVRFAELHDIGCIACMLAGVGWVAPEQDHRNNCDLAGMKRTEGGHDETLALCCWHHRGIPWDGWTAAKCLEKAGPSKHLAKKRFIDRFGTISELHAMQAKLLEKYRAATRI